MPSAHIRGLAVPGMNEKVSCPCDECEAPAQLPRVFKQEFPHVSSGAPNDPWSILPHGEKDGLGLTLGSLHASLGMLACGELHFAWSFLPR